MPRHRARVQAAAREADYLRASVAELSQLDPQPGEETDLADVRTAMMRAEKVATEIKDAQDVLSGQNSPLPQLASLLRRLQRKSTEAPGLLDEVVQSLDEAMLSLDAAQAGRGSSASRDRVRSAAARKGGGAAVCACVRHRANTASRSTIWRGCATRCLPIWPISMQAKSDCWRWKSRRSRRATTMTGRQRGYPNCGRPRRWRCRTRWRAELPALKLERAEFIVEIATEPDNRTENGIDQVEFWVRTNPGTRAGPMMKVASGGELSRFLLALKVALADRGSAPTLVFDEIDTGVGGAVADAIGQRLARLSGGVQVLSVTHAPQVAARATAHFLISKSGDADRVSTGVAEMDRDARQEEIARMLAGAKITEEARAAADRLLRENSA